MKKLIAITVILIITQSFIFSETESWLFLGGEYSKFYETSSDGTTAATSTIDSVGINLSGFTFWNKSNIGFYRHSSFMFPRFGTISLFGETATVDLTEYDFLMSFSLIMGPGFKKNITKYFTFYSGVGVHLFNMSAFHQIEVYEGTISFALTGFNVGLGGDLGMKLDINDINLNISIGTSFTYDFYNNTIAMSNLIEEPIQSIPAYYSALMINPYICISSTSFKGREWEGSK